MVNQKYVSLASAGISALGTSITKGIQLDMQQAAQEYGDTMRQLSAAQQTNTLTVQDAQLQDKTARLQGTLQQASIRDMAASEVNAAAAGVAGGSVTQALLGLKRSAMGAQHARMRNLDSEMFAVDQSKKNIRLATIMGEDISVIQRPSTASALLGLGSTLLDKYAKNQVDGERAIDGARLFST